MLCIMYSSTLTLYTHVIVGSYGEVYRADCNGTVSLLTCCLQYINSFLSNVVISFYLISSWNYVI